jgi:hypothetical protein
MAGLRKTKVFFVVFCALPALDSKKPYEGVPSLRFEMETIREQFRSVTAYVILLGKAPI